MIQRSSSGMLTTTRSRAILAFVITALLVSALVLYILYGEKKPKDRAPTLSKNESGDRVIEGSGDVSPDIVVLTEAGSHPSSTISLINDDETIATTLSEFTTTTSATTTTAFVPADEETKAGLPECSSIRREDRPKCEVGSQPPRTAYEKWTQAGSANLIGEVQPVHYDVNVSIANADSRLLKASAEIFVRIPAATSASIVLHLDRTVINLNASTIFVRDCQTGEFVCVKSIVQLVEKQLVVLVLGTPIPGPTLISIYFEHFDVQIYSNPGFVLQSPSKWEKQRAWILGSLFDEVGSRTMFPSVDQPSAKASWRLCCQYPSNMTSRSNMPSEIVLEREGGSIQNCFHKSPALRPDHFSFVIFDNMLAIHGDSSSPSVEVFVGKHLQSNDNKWIVTEVQTALEKMHEITSIEYPLSKVSIISMPLPADAMGNYGLINVKESWIEYPKYLLTHTILNRQVVRQWISNMFTICDQCLEDGLSTYLEWIVSADFETVKISPRERALDTKQKLLSYGSARSAPLRALLIEPLKNENDCASRAALTFAMLDETFGMEAMKRFVQSLATAKLWGTCIGKNEISDMLPNATLSSVSQQIFNSFMNTKNYPVLNLKLDERALTVTSGNSDLHDSTLFTVAYTVLNEEGKPVNLVSNGSETIHEAPGKTIVVNPIGSGLFRAIYDIANYKRLVECFSDDQCNKLLKDSVQNVIYDLCWALLHNRLDSSNTQKTQWHELFGTINERGLVHGDCQCCMQSKKNSSAQCKWIWKDKCSKLELANDH